MKNLFITLFLMLSVLGVSAQYYEFPASTYAGTGFTYWVTNGPTHAGTGTYSGAGTYLNPFTGDFDNIVSNYGGNHPYSTFHLYPGTYWMAGLATYYGPLGTKIKGSGIDVTFIKQDTNFFRTAANGTCLFTCYQPDLEIEDVTMDSNCLGNETNTRSAICYFSHNNAARRVKFINMIGNLTNGQECFPIFTGDISGSTNDFSYNIIQDCEIDATTPQEPAPTQGFANYISGLALGGSGGLVDKCFVKYVVLTPAQAIVSHFGGGGTGACMSAKFFNNFIYGGNDPYYSDTGWHTNETDAYNYYIYGWEGFKNPDISQGGTDGWNVHDNFMGMNPQATIGNFFSGASYNAATTSLRFLMFNDNLVTCWASTNYSVGFSSSQLLIWQCASLDCEAVQVYNNTFMTGGVITNEGFKNGITWYNNTWESGKSTPWPGYHTLYP